MCSKSSGFWRSIRSRVKSLPLRKSYQIQRPILLGLSALLITTASIPALPAQQVAEANDEIAQLSNPQALLQQGIKLYDAKKFAEAITVFSRAGAIYVNQADRLNQALVLRYLSLAYQHLGQWQEAERAIAQSLNLLENQKRLADNQAYLEVFAKALNTQGRLLFSKGQFSEALEAWRKAAATYKKADNETGIIGSSLNQAEALQALGLSSQAEAELLQVEQILLQQKDLNLRANVEFYSASY